MKHVITVVLLIVGFATAFPRPVSAQSDPCWIFGQSCQGPNPNGPGILVAPPIPLDSLHGTGDLGCVYWQVRTYACAVPPKDPESTCTACEVQAKGGGPINFTTGDTYIMQTDVSVPGLGGGLQLTRTWNSILPAPQKAYGGMFGRNWRTNLEQRLIYSSPDHYVRMTQSDGAVWSFVTETASNTVVYRTIAPGNKLTRITSGDTVYSVAEKDGTKKLFSSFTGLLTSIIDRNGNADQLTYDSANRLTTVTDAAQRHLYFSYPDNTSTLVATVTSDVGISLSYTYDAQGQLIKVTKPDNTAVSFDYDANSMITAVRDNDGKILEAHTYDANGRGLTSTRANGVESITVTYP
jgi:YD repeat-containing protein